MGLVSLHTRLTSLLTAARHIRGACADLSALSASAPVSANVIVELAQNVAGVLSDVVADAEGDAELVTYAAGQFAGQEWTPLDQQIAGVKALLTAVVAACRATVPMDGSNRLLKDTWNTDGTVSVRRMTSAETASLRAVLDAVTAAIPE